MKDRNRCIHLHLKQFLQEMNICAGIYIWKNNDKELPEKQKDTEKVNVFPNNVG